MIEILQIDAFADGPFTGNPAAVCLMDRAAGDGWLQALAAENNLSETAYLWPLAESETPDDAGPKGQGGRKGQGSRAGKENSAPDPRFRLRWFTPRTEVDLCGHATLASAHALFESRGVAPGATIRFETRSGILTATRRDELIELDFPEERAAPVADKDIPEGLLESLGLMGSSSALVVARNRFDYLIEVPSADVVRGLAPDFRALGRITTRGTIVTARAEDARFDFVSRFFAPAEGIDEDPATGSAHCALGPWWSGRLGGKKAMVGFQASARGAVVRVELAGGRVRLGGKAVTVFRGEIARGAEP